ncbi:MAG: hypothetical protein ACT4RN_12170 [Pseudonocardia sp.]
MALPGFTSAESCYRSPRSYRTAVPVRPPGDLVVAQFHCEADHVCTCDGLADCIHMFEGPLCSQVAACDSTHGLVCGCIEA